MRARDATTPARLALSTGEVFRGAGFGAAGEAQQEWIGEVVFNTAMSGYQESLTDPSYAGQILVQTTPLIGNTGMNPLDTESGSIRVAALVVHEHVDRHSSYRATRSLHETLRDAGVAGLSGIDTRALTRLLRSRGVTTGVVAAAGSRSDAELVAAARSAPSMEGRDLVSTLGEGERGPGAGAGAWSWIEPFDDREEQIDRGGQIDRGEPGNPERPGVRVGLIDCGCKENIVRSLIDAGADPVRIHHETGADAIRAMLLSGEIRGLMLSNGPGDPAALDRLVATVRALAEDPDLEPFPIFGICLGHQVLALAQGAATSKLAFGHRGINHPVLDVEHGRVLITSQNHGFVVERADLAARSLVVTHDHLNDGTVAGIRHARRPIRSVQFHPEASPGPHDAAPFFADFVRTASGSG